MTNIDHHPPGTFSWVELMTTDQNAAKNFYGSLFGWAAQDTPVAHGSFYTMFQLQGRFTGAAYTLRPDQKEQGVPPNWMLYVAVTSADDVAARVPAAGGKVCASPFDIFDVGRMAVLQDPTGAVISVWEAKKHPGTQITAVDGTLCWADLITPDPARVAPFYSQVFGWKIKAAEGDTSGYLHIQAGEKHIGGIPPASNRNAQTPAHWLVYFHVSDCDKFTEKTKQLGGSTLMPPATMERVGRWSIVRDPQGAVFALFQPAAHR